MVKIILLDKLCNKMIGIYKNAAVAQQIMMTFSRKGTPVTAFGVEPASVFTEHHFHVKEQLMINCCYLHLGIWQTWSPKWKR
jgi:hypothetical protein